MDDFNFKNATLGKIPTALIRENAEALRVAVNKQDPDYVELVDSVRKRGILNPILVREIKDPVTGGKLYGLIDGLHRFNAAMDAGFSEVPAQIGSLEEGDLLEAQMLANVHRIETKAAQYSKALVKVLGSNPTLTIAELAGRLSKSPKWLQDRLGLVKLTDGIQKLVDDGKLVLVNAYALSKLPPEKQEELLNQAIAKSPAEFVGQADNVRRELAKAKREGRPAVAAFAPTERQQKLGLIKSERTIANDNPAESAIVKAAKANGVTTVEEAVAYTLNWVLHLDPVSIAKDKAEYDAEKANAAAEKERKAAVKKEAERIAAETLSAGASA